MPFISKDWRSPGEEWVKTEEGWEKKKILECSHLMDQNNFDTRYIRFLCLRAQLIAVIALDDATSVHDF